jgi:hypothetical protein
MSLLDTLRNLLRFNGSSSATPAIKRGAENRRTRRIPQRMRGGYVWAEKLLAPRQCVFKDLSVGGARIEIIGEPIKPSLLDDGLSLYFDSERHEIPCSVAWMKGAVMGVRFDGRPRPPSRQYG